MSERAPTYESIFTEEYWGDLLDLPQRISAVPAIGAHSQMRKLTAAAAEAVFFGLERIRLPLGAKIDPCEENFDLAPGTVTLLDYETLHVTEVNDRSEDIVDDIQRPFYKQRYITEEGHLMTPAAALFTRNSLASPYGKGRIVYPYTKCVPNTEDQARYSRSIRLAACGIDVEDKPMILEMPLWRPGAEGIRGQCSLKQATNLAFQPMEVGQSLIHEANNLIIRLRSAEICLQGTIERAKARKKSRAGLRAARLAFSKNPA